MGHEPNLAVIEAEQKRMQTQLDKLQEIVGGLVITTNNLVQACKFCSEKQHTFEASITPVVDKLKEQSSKLQGGWMVIAFVVGVVATPLVEKFLKVL